MKTLCSLFFLTLLIFTACQTDHTRVSEANFKQLMQQVARGWSTQNTALALSSFHPNAVYMQPPKVQFYQGHKQLKPYFDALTEEYRMEFHHLWFDEKSQTGVGEFTFSYGEETADVGIAVVEIKDGKIAFWREYLQKGPTDFQQFIATEGKEWEWHIGNYPEPKEAVEIEEKTADKDDARNKQ